MWWWCTFDINLPLLKSLAFNQNHRTENFIFFSNIFKKHHCQLHVFFHVVPTILLCNVYLLTTYFYFTHIILFYFLYSFAYIYINHPLYSIYITVYPYFIAKASRGINSSTFLDTLIIVPLNCKGLRSHTCLQS